MPYERVLDTMACLCPDVIAAVQAYIAAWRARFRQDGWHPTQWSGCCDGVNGTFLEGFVTDTRQQVLAAYAGASTERQSCSSDAPGEGEAFAERHAKATSLPLQWPHRAVAS